jgi:hypothetical protein
VDDDVYWFDSCGDPTSVFDDCSSGEECVDTVIPPECRCLPGWIGLDCETYVCDSGTETGETCATATTVGRDDLPIVIAGNNSDPVAPDINVACGATTQPGHDLAYRVYLFAGEILNVAMDPTANDDLSVFAFFDPAAAIPSCSTATLLACDDNGGAGVTENLTIVADGEGWYEIVVDTRTHGPAGEGPFTLSLSIHNPVAGQCYDDAVTPCTDQAALFDWSDATAITAPMTSVTSATIGGMVYIYTSVANGGTATHAFDIPCDGTWYLWGLRWKPSDTLATFRFQVDGQPNTPITWNMAGGANSAWGWDQANGATTPVWSSALTAGPHVLTILGGTSTGAAMNQHPALGYVIFTNNPAFVPPILPGM